MKKQLTAVLLVFVLMLTMAGCSTVHALQKLDAAEERMEDRLDMAEEKLEDSLRQAAAPAPETMPADIPVQTLPEATEAASVPADTKSGAVKTDQPLTREQAQQIALDYLGVTADQVTRLRTGYEIDDGIPQYDVEFIRGDWEYEFEIHGETGKILSYDKDHKYD